jgi:hypothetical protein
VSSKRAFPPLGTFGEAIWSAANRLTGNFTELVDDQSYGLVSATSANQESAIISFPPGRK